MTLWLCVPAVTVYVPPSTTSGVLMTTQVYRLAGVKLASTVPLSSVSVTCSVLPPLNVTNILPCVELVPKFCAMPVLPAANTIPPVMLALPSQSMALSPSPVEPLIYSSPPLTTMSPLESMPSPPASTVVTPPLTWIQ